MPSSEKILKVISVRQMKAARSLLDWSQKDLADASGVSEPVVKRIEAADADEIGGRANTAEKIIAALEKGGVEFIPENGGGAGVRLTKKIGKPY
jgi:predicted transcriptional regulator